jgi:hypothetical protein
MVTKLLVQEEVSSGIVGRLMSAPARTPNRGRAGSVAIGPTPVIQAPKLGARIMRYELADYDGLP